MFTWAYTIHTYIHPFNSPFSGTTWMSRYQKCKTSLDFTASKRQWVAVASAGPYASLHLTLDRQSCQHPTTTQFLQTGFPSCCPTHSVKGSKHWRHIQVLHKYLGVKCKYQALWCHCICFLFLCYLQHFDSCLLTSEQFLLQHFTQLEELLISASMP